MSGEWAASFESLGTLPRKVPIKPGAVTNRKELEDAIRGVLRGTRTTLGSPSLSDRVNAIADACDAYAAVQITLAITPEGRR